MRAAIGDAPFEDDFSYDGSSRARVDMCARSIAGQSAGSFIAYDGSRLLMYDAASNTYVVPNIAPDFSPFNLIGDVSWRALQSQSGRCDPVAVDRDWILGWDVVHVHCGSRELWIAPEIGLILRTVEGSRRLEAARLELRPTFPADFFSAPPPGSRLRE